MLRSFLLRSPSSQGNWPSIIAKRCPTKKLKSISDTTGSSMTTNVIKAGIKYAITPSSLGRDLGYETEKNDCFVQAMRHVTGVPYRDAHGFVSAQFNRRHRKGTFAVVARMQNIVTNSILIF